MCDLYFGKYFMRHCDLPCVVLFYELNMLNMIRFCWASFSRFPLWKSGRTLLSAGIWEAVNLELSSLQPWWKLFFFLLSDFKFVKQGCERPTLPFSCGKNKYKSQNISPTCNATIQWGFYFSFWRLLDGSQIKGQWSAQQKMRWYLHWVLANFF